MNMIDEKNATIAETVSIIEADCTRIARCFGEFKKKSAAPDVAAFFHRAQHIFEECSRTTRELLATASPGVLESIEMMLLP